MVVRTRAVSYAISPEFESVGRTNAVFISEEQSSLILPGKRLVRTSKANFSYFVSPLLIHCGNRPKLVQNQGVWSFECDEDTRFDASRGEGDVGEDGGREGVFGEIVDERIVEFEGRKGIAY